MLIEQKTSNRVPNPDRGCMFIDTGTPAYVRPSWSNHHRECSLTNAAGCASWPWHVYKHATPDGVGSVSARKRPAREHVVSRESST